MCLRLRILLLSLSRTFSTTGSERVWPMVTVTRSGIRQRRGYQWGEEGFGRKDWAEASDEWSEMRVSRLPL